jgi:dienelactone hydrolase
MRAWTLGVALLCAGVAGGGQAVRTLPGTQPLTWEGDLSEKMMDGAHRYIERQIAHSIAARQRHWRRDPSSPEAYEKSVAGNRARFLEKIGVVDARRPPRLERFGDDANPALVAETAAYRIFQVRWAVLEGVAAEGLLIEPLGPVAAKVVALPDADQTPEQIAGLAPGIAPEAQFARLLAEAGCLVLVPTMIDRTSRWSGHPHIRMTDQTHREWIYRQAFQMGRHVIGYEVQKTLAALDWFAQHGGAARTGVAGYGEGGLVAFYAAAADTRIDAALVSGYFNSRQGVWSEPIYRNVWGLLEEFGDAELATLVAPRGLVVEYSAFPEVKGHKGDMATPPFDAVAAEFARIDKLLAPGFQPRTLVRGEGSRTTGPASEESLREFLRLLGASYSPRESAMPVDRRQAFDPGERQMRQVRQLEAHVQQLVRGAEHVREAFYLHKVAPEFADRKWSTKVSHPTRSAPPFIEASRWYRDYFWNEVLGKFHEPMLPFNARTRLVYDRPKWVGYEVVLDVWEDVFVWGILLVPKDVVPGERRPVVVCQHGRGAVPAQVIEPENSAYNAFAARLADRGFIVFAPHNLYRGEDRYRWLDRKANSVKASLFSFITAQHDQHLRWLKSLPIVDGDRIAFYGLSYGGETAVRVPAVLEGYALSICSGDFNAWTWKVAATDERFSFMYTIEWEMPYFNLGSTFDYAEMAYLIFPRPFMVERGHDDRVGEDRWVAYEYAKVRRLYAQMGIPDRTAIEYFNGGHAIHGVGTFEFLHRHLNWPAP